MTSPREMIPAHHGWSYIQHDGTQELLYPVLAWITYLRHDHTIPEVYALVLMHGELVIDDHVVFDPDRLAREWSTAARSIGEPEPDSPIDD